MNARKQHVDKTYLSIETAEQRGFIHRDYIAHCLRWSHVIKCLNERQGWREARLLDVGCGRELPLATTLYSSRFNVKAYYGVDVGPVNDDAMDRFHTGKFNLNVFENTDVLNIRIDADLDGEPVNWVTCFEMLEHVEPLHMIQVLEHIRTLISQDATLFFSTPCWNERDCAANHVNEIKFQVLGSIFEALGYQIEKVHGTFASIADYSHLMNPEMHKIFTDLRAYYDSNLLSVIFAPLFPAQARNALWELSPHQMTRSYPKLRDIPKPWGSSELWEEVENRIA